MTYEEWYSNEVENGADPEDLTYSYYLGSVTEAAYARLERE